MGNYFFSNNNNDNDNINNHKLKNESEDEEDDSKHEHIHIVDIQKQIESYFYSGFFDGWLPKDINKLETWRKHLISNTLKNYHEHYNIDNDDEKNLSMNSDKYFNIKNYHKSIQNFYNLIESDAEVYMLLNEMIAEIPRKTSNKYHINSIKEFLLLLDKLITIAPEYNESFEVGTPFSAVLIWTMSTKHGFSVYRNEKINNCFKEILIEWRDFLCSKQSLYVLDDNYGENGWKNNNALKKLKMYQYKYDKEDKYFGFKSWNDFFTRKKLDEYLIIDEPENHKIIIQGCDSTLYRISFDVKLKEKFWIKQQPYSIQYMLDNKFVDQFINGSIYQAYLSPFNYHRWHSPISGTIKLAYVKQGLYFSQSNYCGGYNGININKYNKHNIPADHHNSQSYITHVQTRALFFIECDDKNIGLICFMPVGMVEVSSCIIHKHIKKGYHVKKGEELGYFQFGGSTHCIFFREGVIKEFTINEKEFRETGKQIAIAN